MKKIMIRINKVCDVIYRKGDQKLVVSYDYEDYVKLNKNSIKAYEFKTENGQNLYFDHKDVSRHSHTYKEMMAEETLSVSICRCNIYFNVICCDYDVIL